MTTQKVNVATTGEGSGNEARGEVASGEGRSPRRRNRRELPDLLRDDELINADQFAALIGISKRQLYRWMQSGDVPAYDLKIGQTCRWKVSSVKAWQSQQEQRAA